MEGLLDTIWLGNLLEACWVYDSEDQSELEKAQRSAIRVMYMKFQDRFIQHHALDMQGRVVCPKTWLFDPSFVQLASSLVKYKDNNPDSNSSHTPKEIRTRVIKHVSQHRPQSLPALQQLLGKSTEEDIYCQSFNYAGPKFTVVESSASRKRKRNPESKC